MSLLLLKVSVLLTMALVAARLLHRAPAAARHRLWSFAFAAMLMLPALAASLPALHVPVPAGWEPAAPTRATFSPSAATIAPPIQADAAPVTMASEAGLVPGLTGNAPRSSERPSLPSLSSLLFAIWLTGVVGAVATVLHSLWRVRRLVRTAEAVSDDGWQRAVAMLGTQLGVRHRVRLLSSPRVGTPMAGGIWRPAIFLPHSAASWNPEHRDLVLAHELAHLAGHDPLRHLMTRLALACYWFHPLAWLAAREAAIAREQACDETVLAMGARPSAYARLLLDLAESVSAKAPARLLGALPMVHRSHLERRLMAILNRDIRPAARRFVAAPAIVVALLTLSVAAAQPFDKAQGRPLAQATTISANDVALFANEQARPFAETQARPFAETYAKPFADTYARPVAEKIEAAFAGAPAGQVPGPQVPGVPVGPSPGVPAGPLPGVSAGPLPGIPVGQVHGLPQGPVTAFGAVGAPTADVQDRDSACWSDGYRGNFIGSSSSSRIGGRTVIYDQVGWRNGDRIIQRLFGDLRLCMLAESAGDRDRDTVERPSQWIGRARRVVMEARRGSTVQRLEFNGTSPTWTVGNSTRDFDSAAQTWRDRMLAVLDTTWELSTLRGEESSLRGQISSIQGQRSSLQGQISSLQGQVSSMQGRISSTQGQVSSLRGQISSIQGHVSSLQGAISSEQGAISSLTASRYNSDAAERSRIAARIADHRAQIARIEREIEDYDADRRIAAVEREIEAFDARRKINAIEDEIRNFDLDGKVRAIQRRIDDLDVRGRVAGIERQIERLDVPRRSSQLEDRLDAELVRLTSAISAIR